MEGYRLIDVDISVYVTGKGFGIVSIDQQHTSLIHKFINGECLLRCDINAGCLIHIHKHPTVTCGENLLKCGNSCSHYNYYNPIYIVKTSLQVFPGRPVYFTLPQGLGCPPNSLPRLRETPYDARGLPCSYQRSVDISSTQKGRVSPNSLYPSD